MKSEEFIKLYSRQDIDEFLTPFESEIGFSLIRKYPKDSQYEKDGKRMFIKVAILGNHLFYSVDMTSPKEIAGEPSYTITDGTEYKKKVTNFYSDADKNDEFTFDKQTGKITHTKTSKEFSMNDFVEILMKNHLSDRLFWKRIKNSIASMFLQVVFWLSNKQYERVQVSIDKFHFKKGDKPVVEEDKSIEPFFKYFYISKNFIFAILLSSFVVATLSSIYDRCDFVKQLWISMYGDFTLSNPMVVLLFFLALFASEKVSTKLNKKIKEFLIPEESMFSETKPNFIEKIHDYQYKNKFDLRV